MPIALLSSSSNLYTFELSNFDDKIDLDTPVALPSGKNFSEHNTPFPLLVDGKL
jgi:hypothetical protein